MLLYKVIILLLEGLLTTANCNPNGAIHVVYFIIWVDAKWKVIMLTIESKTCNRGRWKEVFFSREVVFQGCSLSAKHWKFLWCLITWSIGVNHGWSLLKNGKAYGSRCWSAMWQKAYDLCIWMYFGIMNWRLGMVDWIRTFSHQWWVLHSKLRGC